MIPTSIDGTDITGATIDGQDVQEITVDGQTVFSATFTNYIEDDFDDNSLSRPRTGQQDGDYETQDGTTLTDARIRPDWDVTQDAVATGGVLELQEGGTTNSVLHLLETPVSIQPPVYVEFDYTFGGPSEGDSISVGFSTNSGAAPDDNATVNMDIRPGSFSAIRNDGSITFPENNVTYGSSGSARFEFESTSQNLIVDNTTIMSSSFNIDHTFNFLSIGRFDDDNFQSKNTIENLKVFD